MLKLSKLDLEKKKVYEMKLAYLSTEIEELINEYNGFVNSTNNLVEDIQQRQQDYFDARSENWQESDRGSDYESWESEWECFDPIEEIECPDLCDISEFQGLPESMD